MKSLGVQSLVRKVIATFPVDALSKRKPPNQLGPSFLAAVILVLSLISASEAYSWGERGHQIVSRVAAALLKDRHRENPKLYTPFVTRTEMLAHLANIPDIGWKSLDKEVSKSLDPSHWFDTEYLMPSPSLKQTPRQIHEIKALIIANCEKTTLKDRMPCPEIAQGQKSLDIAGSAPWRVAQFAKLSEDALKLVQQALKHKTSSEADYRDAIDQALLYAGLMGHFVGDLAQPMHTSADYDGWQREQGGLHAYFESEAVDALPLGVDDEVFAFAKAQTPSRKLITQLSLNDKQLLPTYLDLALALNFDSFQRLDYLFGLDSKGAVLTKSVQLEKGRTSATRKLPADSLPVFRDLLIERLAYGADALATFWEAIWRNAGEPDLSAYRSFRYHLNPEAVKLDYLP